jgi:hypothetical protein
LTVENTVRPEDAGNPATVYAGEGEKSSASGAAGIADAGTVLNGIKISQKKQKNKVFPTANTKESVKR